MDITDNIPLHQGNIPRSEVIVLTKMPLTFDITANKSSVHKFDSAMPFVIYIAISVNEVKNALLVLPLLNVCCTGRYSASRASIFTSNSPKSLLALSFVK